MHKYILKNEVVCVLQNVKLFQITKMVIPASAHEREFPLWQEFHNITIPNTVLPSDFFGQYGLPTGTVFFPP
jgi:hypothetical protein